MADTEIGCWGWATTDDPLLVTELWVPEQTCTVGSVDREHKEWLKNVMEGEKRGLTGPQCSRVWLHTHPGNSAQPSGIDENYWKEHGDQHGHVMGIMAKGGETYARLAVRTDEYRLDLEMAIECVMSPDIAVWAKEQVDTKRLKWKPAVVQQTTPGESKSGGYEWINGKWERKGNDTIPLHDATGGKLSRKARKRAAWLDRQNRSQMTDAEKERYERLAARADDPNGSDLTNEEIRDLIDLYARAL